MHQIRLKRPWLRTTPSCVDSIRVDVPDTEPLEAEPGDVCRVSYARAFNCPTGLTDQDRVAIVITAFRGDSATIQLNGRALVSGCEAQDTPLKIDITSTLDRNNQLSIQLCGSPDNLPLLDGSVRLEIDDT